MKRRTPRAAVSLLLILVVATAAAADPRLGKAAIAKAASRIEACLGKQSKSSNRRWSDLSSSLDEKRFAALKSLQKQWLSWRDAKCGFFRTDDPSMMGYMNAADCRMDETARRVIELRDID